MGKGTKSYKETMKSGDILVAEGIVAARSVLGSMHRARSASASWAVRTVRQHPGLHHAADQVLRASGVTRLTYGRI